MTSLVQYQPSTSSMRALQHGQDVRITLSRCAGAVYSYDSLHCTITSDSNHCCIAVNHNHPPAMLQQRPLLSVTVTFPYTIIKIIKSKRSEMCGWTFCCYLLSGMRCNQGLASNSYYSYLGAQVSLMNLTFEMGDEISQLDLTASYYWSWVASKPTTGLDGLDGYY